jgi:antitoxin (DNA-binding transcriptional repressor) of toxin-antitoxin stability system
MKTINVLTETTTLLDLVKLAYQETEVVLTEDQKPVAKVLPIAGPSEKQASGIARRQLGLHPGAWEASSDFDEPLPEQFWLGFP